MKRAVLIDAAGYFAGDIYGDPEYQGEEGRAPAWAMPCPFIRPRWNGIAWEEGEKPETVERLSRAATAANLRAWRNAQLDLADKKVNDAIDRGNAAALDAWTRYRIALRDLPQQAEDPRQWVKPEAPR